MKEFNVNLKLFNIFQKYFRRKNPHKESCSLNLCETIKDVTKIITDVINLLRYNRETHVSMFSYSHDETEEKWTWRHHQLCLLVISTLCNA